MKPGRLSRCGNGVSQWRAGGHRLLVGIAFFIRGHDIQRGNLQLLGVLAYAAPLIRVLLLVIAGVSKASNTLAGIQPRHRQAAVQT